MSGKKHILVDETEWYQAQRAAQNLRQVRRDVPRLLNEVRRRTEADQARTRAELEEHARRTEQALSGLSAHTRRLEQDTGRRLREQSERLHKDLRHTADRLERDTRTALDEQRAALERELAAERDQRHRDIAALTGHVDELTGRVDELAGNRERAATATRGWLADGVTMSEFIATTLPHERHAPGRLDRLRLDLDTARQNSDIGHYEAALSLAQRAYLDLSELRLDIEHRELERRLAATAATDALVLVETLLTENEVRPVMGPDGQPLPGVELDVDHWSEGELKELREQLAERLTRARDDATTAAQQRELTAEAADLEHRLGEIVDRAGMRQLASQLRVNLADSVAETLSRIGAYELADGEYQDEDERRSYHAVLQHANGNKIVVQVLPAPDGEAGQVLRVLSYDYDTVAEREIRDRAEAVRRALQEDGHPTGPLETELGVPEPEATDLNRIRRNRAQPGKHTAPGGSS
ncbi:hypothetical protein ABTZ59_30765 [Streptomyces sp. NPDC094034]|uniref:hypothetical protein n=1 Tax=Streptomyces sp. NPDC094034 TaxID=3155309 RepID=UPI00333466E4